MSFELFEYKIEDLGKVITGKTPPSKISDAFSAQGIPFVTPKDMDGRRIIDKTERYLSSLGVEAVRNCLLPQNSIAVSCIGSDMGKTVLLPGESITNQQINAIIVDSERFDYKYVYYYLSTLQDAFKAIAGGSATPILNKGNFSQFKVSLPVKLVQNKIALILNSLDTKIEVNTEINQTLEQMAEALFKSWFVDFEPVKAKMAALEAGGSQEDAMLAAMTAISGKDADALAVFEREHPEQYAELKATAELFPSAMQDSGLGAIPDGWKLGCIGSISKRIKTKVGSTKAVVFSAVASGKLVPSDEHFTKQVYSKSIDKYILVEQWSFAYNPSRINIGSIGLNVRNECGAVSPVYVVFKTELEYKWYVDILTRTTYFKNNVNTLASGSVRQSLSYDDLSSIPLCIPDISIVNIFNNKYEEYLTFIEKYRNQINTLISIRDTLLPKLLSGEITLPEAEQIISKEA
ncbi:Predicted nucleotidyltransferases [Enterobacter hormaechei]|uniref:restriction endonuclease subunit S n=1 Tax=Enterobacteriaceae TaxID=543 RepID=UPI0007960AD2|nr:MULTISPECIES: restriction endonuclease subunit S [Enterobacteriaceae]EFN4842587.1 restriction endonuclease subunit S [Escherichia coli]EGD4721942.1 restriction endonuclease subunit S [Escherichia coli]EGD4768808.1 restriction endonuclease subunit S [Escherichia coli]EGD5016427.1 restriction endonuclease subunit S [Escherichia coli]EGD5064988.1 restriction endonuclease subunit S [Escherichia coli]